MSQNDNNNGIGKQTLMGHIRLLPKMLFFGMLAYGFIRLLIWITESFEGKT